MADGIVQVPPDSSGKKVDASSLDVGANSVMRQRIVLGNNTGSATFADVMSAGPVGTEGGLIVRNIPSGTQNVQIVSGTAMLGAISLAAGTSNIGYINNISATISVVNVAGTANIGGVSLVAGSSNIGFINHISATIAVVLAAGTGNFGTLNNISATVNCALSYVVEKTTNSQVQVGDSANAAIRVNIVAGAAAGGTSIADRGAFTEATTSLTPAGGVFSDTRSAVAEDKVAALRITNQAGLHVNLRTDGGATMEDSANTALRVNIVAGAAAGGTSIADRGAFTEATTSLTPAGGVFSDTRSAVAEDKVAALRITNQAGLHVNLRDASGVEITAANPMSVKIEQISATGTVLLAAGTANIGTINNISAGVVLAAGVANIGVINNISATVSVLNVAGTANIGGVSLVAGTANIGFINNISATVNVAFAGGISLAAGTANIGFINGISATIAAVLAAGSANIGSINNISRTVVCGVSYMTDFSNGAQVAVADSVYAAVRVSIVNDTYATANGNPSASHGPKCVTCSTSTNVTLVVAPGAGNFIYVTMLAASNASGTGTKTFTGVSGSVSTVLMYLQSAGGGFVMNFDPPWRIESNQPLLAHVKPNASDVLFTVNFYVAPT